MAACCCRKYKRGMLQASLFCYENSDFALYESGIWGIMWDERIGVSCHHQGGRMEDA